MNLHEPLYLLLVLPFLGPVVLALRRRRALGVAMARLAVALAVAVAAAGAKNRQQIGPPLAFLVDASESLPESARIEAAERVEGWRSGIAAERPVSSLVFGGRTEAVPATQLIEAARRGVPGASDLRGALRAAGRLVGPGGRVVLLSDGRHLGPGDAVREAAALERLGIEVYATGAWQDRSDTWIRALSAPPGIQAGGSALLSVVLHAQGRPSEGSVVFYRDGVAVAERPFAVTPGEALSVVARVQFPEAGRRIVEARLEGLGEQDSPENNRAGAVLEVYGPGRILHLGRSRKPTVGETLGPLLGAAEVESRPPRQAALDAATLGAYDLVLLEDLPVSALAPGAPKALRDYVSAGGGLWVLGGRSSFGPGDYVGSHLDEVLPVRSDPRQAGGRMSVVLLLDKSGSMGGPEGGWERMLLAKETLHSLLLTFRHAEDRVGIMGYDTGPLEILPMTTVAELRPEFIDTGRLHPAGGTDPVPALRLAERWLGPADRFPDRHVVLISDGHLPGRGAPEVIAALARRGVRVSAVAIGAAADLERLGQLASTGRGDLSRVREVRDLPTVIARHLLAAPGEPIVEGAISVEAHEDLQGIAPGDWSRVPAIGGMVRTALKPDSFLWLAARSGEPLLAGRAYGAGRVSALMTDVTGPWTAAWQDWPQSSQLLSAVRAWTTRRRLGQWESRIAPLANGGLELSVDAVDGAGEPIVNLHLRAFVDGPGGTRHGLVVPEVAPGRYRAEYQQEAYGTFEATFMVGEHRVARAACHHLVSAELKDRGDALAYLSALAAAGGGRLLLADEPLPPAASLGRAQAPARSGALLLGLLLLLLYVWVEGRRRAA